MLRGTSLTGHLAFTFARADRDNGLIGECGHHLDFAFVERFNAMARQDNDANRLSLAHERHADHRTCPADFCVFLERVGGIAQKVVDLFDVSTHRRPADHGARAWSDRLLPLHVPRIEIAADLEAIDPFVQTKDLPARGVAQPYSGIDHGLQHRLQVEFRSADDSRADSRWRFAAPAADRVRV